MTIKNLVIYPNKTLGRTLILTEVTPRYVYDGSGHRTSEVRGYYYGCVCADRGYMPIRVAIDGPRLLDDTNVIGNSQVTLDTPTIKVYYANGGYHVAISANGIRLVKPIN